MHVNGVSHKSGKNAIIDSSVIKIYNIDNIIIYYIYNYNYIYYNYNYYYIWDSFHENGPSFISIK